MEKEPKPFSEEKAEEIMAETKETTEGEVDLKKMSEEREATFEAGRDFERVKREIDENQVKRGHCVQIWYYDKNGKPTSNLFVFISLEQTKVMALYNGEETEIPLESIRRIQQEEDPPRIANI